MAKRKSSESLDSVLLGIREEERKKTNPILEELCVLTRDIEEYINFLEEYHMFRGGEPTLSTREIYHKYASSEMMACYQDFKLKSNGVGK